MKLARTLLSTSILAAACLTGCSTASPPLTFVDFQPIPLEEAAPELATLLGSTRAHQYVSLGAGDALGRAIYVNNIILAARQRAEKSDAVIADVPTDDSQNP